MPAPTFVQEAEVSWQTLDREKTTGSFNVQAGDVLVAFAGMENGSDQGFSLPDGGSLTWTERTQHPSTLSFSMPVAAIWSAAVDSDKAMTVTLSRAGSGSSLHWGGNVLTFRDSDGIGAASAGDNGTSGGAPSLNITTTRDNSAIVMLVVDWNAVSGASRTYRQVNGQDPVEVTFDNTGADATYVMYGAYYADAGPAGLKTVGLTTPSNQRYVIVAVEVLGVEDGGTQEEGDYTAGSSLGSAFSAIATAAGSITAGVGVSAAVSARAAAVASITEALEAGDTDSAAQAAQRVFAAQVSTDAQYAAIAQAAAAIQAGLEAGEVWAAIAAAEAGLIAGAELGAAFSGETESAQTAALEAGTEAAAQFLGAIAAFGLLESGASASDAFAASARIGASVSSAAQLGASFTTASLNDAVFSAAASLQSAFASEAASIANFSAQASVDDAYSAISVALAAISIGVVLGATFSATSSADVSIVGATASVRAIRRLSATVRAIRPTATLN